jgi:DNA methylase/ParB-like nuclease domain
VSSPLANSERSPMKSALSVVFRPVETLRPYPGNARTHSKLQIRQIAKSIQTFGFTNPVLIDRDNSIIAGHGRVQAAKSIGMLQVPTICLENLDPNQVRAFILADNKLAELAGWDKKILAIELQHLLTLDETFDLTVTGFQIAEVDLILQEGAGEELQEDVVDVDETKPAVTRLGDLWHLGKHRVLCGNALEEAYYQRSMGKKRAKLIFADVPFNLRIQGHVSGNGPVRHREFAFASGEMSQTEFTSFLTTSLGLLARHSTQGSLHFICMDWRHMTELLAAGKEVYTTLVNLCVWGKTNAGLGSFYRSQHELVFVFRNGNNQHLNNIQLGRFGRNRSNLWTYAGMNSFTRKGEESNLHSEHPTPKPVQLVADAILDATARGDLVLDNFLGSGTTVVAAERVGRVCYGMELDPLYVDLAIRRYQDLTGDDAIHVDSGKSFNELSLKREV